ncbi:bifunctional DNA primase/polymerase [Streptomyces sp. URMC 127]|uniref:bifunctional DNA primase/polymerase n=1 Tax=Streptomyces sp. URMC 127 TaxID=3423402 RepID=UPI003F1B2456
MPPTRPDRPPAEPTAALGLALAAATRGLAVIPLSRTKLPAIRSPHRDEPPGARRCRGECGRIGHGVHDATADPEMIRSLFAAAPWATGYGIACGYPPHHLVGLDLDVKHDQDGPAALQRLADTHGFELPPAPTVLTPSGGRHLWLTAPAGTAVPNSVGRLASGIDVRGTGGYLVGPGSRTTGGTYAFAADTPRLPAPAVPPPLLTLMRPATSRSAASGKPLVPVSGKRAVGLVSFVLDATPNGKNGTGRNDRLYWAACRAYETGGRDADGIAAALIEAAVHVGLPEAEARATVASAARSARRSPV